MLLSFHTWKSYEEIIKHTSFICFNRGDYKEAELLKAISFLETKGAEIIFLKNKITDISSTAIRENINNREMLKQYISKDVVNYMDENSVFGE